jgi:hypothetical protein
LRFLAEKNQISLCPSDNWAGGPLLLLHVSLPIRGLLRPKVRSLTAVGLHEADSERKAV